MICVSRPTNPTGNVITDDETIASENKTDWIEQFQDALVDAAE